MTPHTTNVPHDIGSLPSPDRTALVTGAGGDVGRAVTIALVDAGVRVLAVDIDGAALEGTVAAARRPMQLTHAWPAFAWVRLRFRAARETGSKDTMLELTIWKDSVSCQAWRELRVLLARQAALRQWRAQKGGW